MKTIIALSFLGILTHAFQLLPNGITRCLNIGSKTDLDSDKFFTGTWYVTHAKNGTRSTVCREYKTSISKEGSKSTVNLTGDVYYDFGPQRHFLVERCKGSEMNTETGQGQFYFLCMHYSGNENFRFIVDYGLELSVIETDYDNFAIVYGCNKFPQLGSFIVDDLLVLHRDKDKVDTQVETFLQAKYNFTLKSFRARSSSDCPSLSDNKM